jgi:hypothetical protein
MEKPPPIPSGEIPPRIEMRPVRPRRKLTGAGVALAVITVLVTIGSALFFPFWVYPRFLPPGVYPRLLLALPIVFCGVAVAIGGTWVLKKLNIPQTKPDGDSNAA